MSEENLPIVYLARHGETEWAITGQHTGLTDLPLTERGERNARALRDRLNGLRFAEVFTSPLQRVSRTCELAGFGARALIDPDLVEWDYGDYEGRRTPDIHKERPNWQLFFDGCPGGESPEHVGLRADRIIRRVRDVGDNVLVFSSGHFLRALAARWARPRGSRGAAFHVEHRQPERGQLRAQVVAAGDPPVGRHASRGDRMRFAHGSSNDNKRDLNRT